MFGDSPLCLGQVVASGRGLMFNLFVSVDLVDLFDTRVDAILYGLNFNSFGTPIWNSTHFWDLLRGFGPFFLMVCGSGLSLEIKVEQFEIACNLNS